MHEYIPPQQNININISYNVDSQKMSKNFFGKKTSKNTKMFGDKDYLDLNVKVPKKVVEINSKLEQNRQLIQQKQPKNKKKNNKSVNYDSVNEKRIKTQGNATNDPFALTIKKQTKSRSIQKSCSHHYRSVNHQSTLITSKPTSKKNNSNHQKSKTKNKKNHNQSCMIFQKKSPPLPDVQHIISTVGPNTTLQESKVQKKRVNSATLIKKDKMVDKLLNMSIINSQMGGSMLIGSQNRQSKVPQATKNLKLLLSSIDMRLIKQMQTDKKQRSSILQDVVGDGIELITYLNKIKRIPMEKLNNFALKIQRFWRSKVRKSVVQYYSGLFKHASEGVKPQISLISQINGSPLENLSNYENDTYSNIELVQKLADEESEKDKTEEKEWLFDEDEEKQSLSLNIKKYRQIVDKEIKKTSHQQNEQIPNDPVQSIKEKQTEQWKNINKLISDNLNEKGGIINSKELLDELMKQSMLHKQWIQADISSKSHKASDKNIQMKIVQEKTEEREEEESNQDYNWGKYEKDDQNGQKNNWIQEQIMMENGVVQNYLDCGLSNFGLKIQEAIHHNSRQQNNEEQLFSNESDRAQEDEKIYIFPTDDLEQKRTEIEDEINTKRKQKIIEYIVQKLIQEFALDVSSILKKTQNNSYTQNQTPIIMPSNGIITNFQYMRDFIKQLKTFITSNKIHTEKVLENIKINIGPTSKEILSYLRVQQAESSQKDIDEDDEEDGIFVIPNNLFEEFHQIYLEKEQGKKQKPFSKKVKLFYEFWHRSLFQCFNECLDYQRPFGITGAPYKWITQVKLPRNITLGKIPQIFQNAENRLLQLSCSPSGIIYEKPDSPYRQAALSQEHKYQLNQERISRMLATEIMDDEYNWVTYNDEMTQLMVEISQMIEDVLLFQTSTDMKKISRRRKLLRGQENTEQCAIFQIQQL